MTDEALALTEDHWLRKRKFLQRATRLFAITSFLILTGTCVRYRQRFPTINHLRFPLAEVYEGDRYTGESGL